MMERVKQCVHCSRIWFVKRNWPLIAGNNDASFQEKKDGGEWV